MLISSAYASTAAAAPEAAAQGGFVAVLMTFAPLVLVILIFYIFLVRPQQRRMAEYQKLVAGLRKGDRVVTTGGIIGTIHKVEANNTEVMVEIAENVRVRLQRNAVADVLAKTEPVKGDSDTSERKSA
jgi:preprotein translocase subunit YajC